MTSLKNIYIQYMHFLEFITYIIKTQTQLKFNHNSLWLVVRCFGDCVKLKMSCILSKNFTIKDTQYLVTHSFYTLDSNYVLVGLLHFLDLCFYIDYIGGFFPASICSLYIIQGFSSFIQAVPHIQPLNFSVPSLLVIPLSDMSNLQHMATCMLGRLSTQPSTQQ